MGNATGPMVLLGFIPLGFALFWARSVAYHRAHRTSGDDPVRLVLSISAWVCIWVGLLGGATGSLVFLAPLSWIVILGIGIMMLMRYRAME